MGFGCEAVGDKLYCPPCGSTEVLVVDTKTESCYTIDCGNSGVEDVAGKWVGITAVGKKLYCAPHYATVMLVIDTESDQCHTIDCSAHCSGSDAMWSDITAVGDKGILRTAQCTRSACGRHQDRELLHHRLWCES